MALMTQSDGKMAADDEADERPGSRPPPPARKTSSGGEDGFFTIRKRGQGYWTRMITALCAAGFIGMTAEFLYTDVLLGIPERAKIISLAVFVVVAGLFAWWLTNRPQTVEFLIATDAEMKKVSWTTREELIGSTKVVILFMFFTAAFLFGCDLFFGKLFQMLTILKFGPFG